MTNNKTDKPLYKLLNETRTGGEWEVKGTQVVYLLVGNTIVADISSQLDGKNNDLKTQERNANAQYTALAVNNLHLLAEALENIANNTTDLEAKRLATQALNRIK